MTWFVRSARDARWRANELGAFCTFEDDGERFPELGINPTVVEPGSPTCIYHREPHQEGFLVLRSECLLIVEGEDVPVRQWDFFHCPPDVPHVTVGAGTAPALVLAVGSRLGPKGGGLYPADETAVRHGAGVEQETSDPRQAYALLAGRRGAVPRGVPDRRRRLNARTSGARGPSLRRASRRTRRKHASEPWKRVLRVSPAMSRK